MKTDYTWLESWISKIKDKSVLELGAGKGIDTIYLRKIARELIATDLWPIEELKISYVNHEAPLPFKDESFDVVVASLTLHYFSWNQTIETVREVSRVLKTEGLLICRVNSEKDTHYGATGHSEIEQRLFIVNGQQKRFFSRKDITELFGSSWKLENLEEKQIDRYAYPKTIWEFGAIKS